MIRKGLMVLVLTTLFSVTGCARELLSYKSGDMKITVRHGREWIHDFSAMVKNPPQIAIWITDESGNYITTVFTTRKIATEGWIFNKGNRRKEALPYWSYSRGVRYDDGLFLPTKKHPVTDGVTGATPKDDFEILVDPIDLPERFYIYAEINHSTDFNDAWPKSARKGDGNYTGGEEGSGQPALIYRALVDTVDTGTGTALYTLNLAGHSSPDGSTGDLYTDMDGFTTALEIVDSITVEIMP